MATVILVSAFVALTYLLFEASVDIAINLIWNEWANTDEYRLLIVPLLIVLGLIFFGAQNMLDPKAIKQQESGLGDTPKPTLTNLYKIILIGFLSMLAGASLGPEAILVPACITIGLLVGKYTFNKNQAAARLLGATGFIALFAAFFSSFFAGMLGLLVVTKQVKAKITPLMVGVAVLASYTTVKILDVFKSPAFVDTPHHKWLVSSDSLLALLALLIGGYLFVLLLKSSNSGFTKLIDLLRINAWWSRALVGSIGLGILYLLGGSLVQFTGNQSIIPLAEQSADLGLQGLLLIFFVKILAISWSKASGYRGGLIFPSVLAASSLVLIAKLWAPELSFIVGLIAVLMGIFLADRRAKILI